MQKNNYETVFILNPVLSDIQVKDTVEKFKKVLVNGGAEVTNEENWGLKTLAYPVQAKNSGYYTLFQFNAPTSLIRTLEIEFVRDENVIRFLTTVLDKFAFEYSEKRKKGSFKKTKEVAA